MKKKVKKENIPFVTFSNFERLIDKTTFKFMNLKSEFTEIIEEYKAVIYKVCYVYAQDKEEINDYYQEILINLWNSYPKFRGESKISTWIYKVSLNTCITFIRKKKRKPSTTPLSIDVTLFEDSELYKLINRLEKMEKTLILLWLEEKNYDEIAEITGLTRSNVAVKLMRIKNKLKELSNE
jgi:RNA polymerase sigma-70 factor, ECF subfamily